MLQCRRWESTKNSLQHYRRRTPEQTQVYRVVYHKREELPRGWEERFLETCGVLRDEVLTRFDKYLNCGLLAHGAAGVEIKCIYELNPLESVSRQRIRGSNTCPRLGESRDGCLNCRDEM